MRRSVSAIASGLDSCCMRSRDAASSSRSIALSGSLRSDMYRWACVTAAMSAPSVMCTPWCAWYLSLRPRMMVSDSAIEGSGTRTDWKRLARAASFSINRYSLSVVAPTQASSPRASGGFNRLDASIAPSAAPAPTTVCSSSMKRIVLPAVSATSLSTAFSRSSNSPRYFAPAMSAPTSSETTEQSRMESGTSRSTIRCARPSTTAVFPTPGSPMSTGLFLRRRERTWMVLRISSSRPMTGSSKPSRACAVRSVPYFLRASPLGTASGLTHALPPPPLLLPPPPPLLLPALPPEAPPFVPPPACRSRTLPAEPMAVRQQVRAGGGRRSAGRVTRRRVVRSMWFVGSFGAGRRTSATREQAAQ
mmetsp:Transcript_84595/g.168918  ORF Transcript_84595/g.168918 Transcript_84595/m.168918 type:complete len:362 (-) Transcript_84595:23-1108(-)